MSERENLLLRWARLKQAAKAAEEIDAASAVSPQPAMPEAPFDPASLPAIESIAPDTDIIAFLGAGVPAALMRAALRRAWTSDPAIRDFIGIAENQWDFNDPNAIAGFGPLAATESSVDILAQISSGFEQQPRAPDDLTVAEPAPSSADACEIDRHLATMDPLLASPSTPNEVPTAGEGEKTLTASETRRTRRHGSALPH